MLRNTKQMLLDPEPHDDFCEFSEPQQKDIRLMLFLSGEKLQSLVFYPVIVEMWEKKKDGSRKRKWEATFSTKERDKISRYYAKFYRWYFVSGTPQKVCIAPMTIELLMRAANFFGTL